MIRKVTTADMSRCELFGMEFCSVFDIGDRPSHRRKRSTSEACFDLRCGESTRSTSWAGKKELVEGSARRPKAL